MKKTFIFFNLFFLIITLVACGRNDSKYTSLSENTSVSGIVKVVKGDYESPLNDTVISINNKQTKTSENGGYSISNLKEGEAIINLFIDSEGKGLNSDTKILTQSHTNSQQKENSQILIWSKKINLDSGDNLVNIDVSPLGEVLRFDQSKWQLAFYASPPREKESIKGLIIDPNGKEYDMKPHFGSQWHKYWNITEPIPGYFKYKIDLDDGSQRTFKVYISEDDFNITFPDLYYPINCNELNTTTPTFKYSFSPTAEKAYLRIEEKISKNEWNSKNWILVDNNSEYTIESGILKKGKSYRWTIQPVIKAKVFPG